MVCKKQLLIFFPLSLLFITIANAETSILSAGDEVTVNGKNIKLTNVGHNIITVYVDGNYGNVEKVINETGNGSIYFDVNGALIAVLATSTKSQNAIIDIIVEYECGNNICEESSKTCCTDCNCSLPDFICENNICIPDINKSKHECNTNKECNDNIPCTIDICDHTLYPTKCKSIKQTNCINDDQCCPINCNNADNDCLTTDQCTTIQDCNDNNPCTAEQCSGSPKKCTYTTTKGCILNNECFPTGTVKDNKYCEETFILQKSFYVSCSNNYECLSGICDNNQCVDKIEKTRNYYKIILYTVFGLLFFILLFYTILATLYHRNQ